MKLQKFIFFAEIESYWDYLKWKELKIEILKAFGNLLYEKLIKYVFCYCQIKTKKFKNVCLPIFIVVKRKYILQTVLL